MYFNGDVKSTELAAWLYCKQYQTVIKKRSSLDILPLIFTKCFDINTVLKIHYASIIDLLTSFEVLQFWYTYTVF